MPFHLFVSYSDKDRCKIEPVLFCVRNIPESSTGLLDVFFYEDSKTPSANTTEEIVEAIRRSDAILYFHSCNSTCSEYVQNEVGGAVVSKKQVIIAKLDETPVGGMVQGANYLDFTNVDVFQREMDALLKMIKANIEARQTPAITKPEKQQRMVTQTESGKAQGSVRGQLVFRSTTSIQCSYAIEDWQILLAIVAAVALAFFLFRASKQ